MKKNNKGFSLIEIIVALTLLAIATTVLAPSLLQYVERGRAERDANAMNDVCVAIESALADPIVMNELASYSEFGNVACYIDSESELTYERQVLRESEEQGVLQYTFDDDCRTVDEVPYYPAGNMRGVTITLTSTGTSRKDTEFILEDAKVNKYYQDVAAQTTLGSIPGVFEYVKSAVSAESIKATSNTYRNSEYTIFVKMTMGGQVIETADGSVIEVYGQWGGTNLPAGDELHTVANDRIIVEEELFVPDADFDSSGNTIDDEIILAPPIQGGGDTGLPETYTQYSITYYYGIELGAIPPVGNPVKYDITTPEFTLIPPTRDGYKFKGWTSTDMQTPQPTVTITPGTTGNKTFYANEERNWELDNYTISYTLNGGTNDPQNPATYTVKDGDIVLKDPTYAGAVFQGWTGSNGTTPQKQVVIPAGTKGNKNYVANWEWYNYPIIYDMNDENDGDGLDNPASNPNPKTYTLVTPTFKLKSPTKKGWTFIGWTNSNGSTPEMEPEIVKGSTGTKRYTANWEINTYYVDLNHMVNGTLRTSSQIGTADVYINGVQVANDKYDYYVKHPHGTKWAIMDIKPYPGYKYDDAKVYEGVVDGKSCSANIHWLSIIYKIVFDANGGTCSETLREIPYEYTYQGKKDASGNFEYGDLPIPTRSGYTFEGWYTEADGGTQVLSTDLIGTSDITLHAHWTKQ